MLFVCALKSLQLAASFLYKLYVGIFYAFSSDIRLSLNQRTPLEEDSTLSDAGLVHGDTIYVMIPPGVTCNISLSSSSTSQQMDEAASCSMNSSSAEVRVGANSEQVAESHNDLGQASSETMMACGDADVVQDDVTMQTDEGLDVEINRYLNEPMLIREATESSLPQSLVKLYDEVHAPGSFRALAVLLKVLMNELGYLEEDKASIYFKIRIMYYSFVISTEICTILYIFRILLSNKLPGS